MVYLKWAGGTNVREAFIGYAKEDFDPTDALGLEEFTSESDRWVFEYGTNGELLRADLASDPGTYRRFTYNPDRDFFDSIVEYREDTVQRILKYQYSPSLYELMGVLELSKTGDTLAAYTFVADVDPQAYPLANNFYRNSLFGIPSVQCRYLYLNGPLWVWHFPFPVRKLFKDGALVYEASFYYDASGYPERVDYRRKEDSGAMLSHSEEILSEVIKI